MAYRCLTDAMAEQFVRDGYIHLPAALDRDFADAQVNRAFAALGYDRQDPSTWVEPRLHLPARTHWPVAEIAPRARDAIADLLGGDEERFHEPKWADAFIFNFHLGQEQPEHPPSIERGGWHKDGDFFRHFLDSPEQALLVFVCWTDVVPRGGPTYIAPESVGVVARDLAAHPEGYRPEQMPIRTRWMPQCSRFVAATARAGDVYLLHPFMLHSASANAIRAPRVISNPPVSLKQPMRFDRERAADHSLVERAVLRALGVERLAFSPTAERQRIVPERIRRQEELARRLDAAEQRRT